MNVTRQLFTPEEAFVRLGQLREAGCLVVVSPEMTVRIFVENGCVVAAASEKMEGEEALDMALRHPAASHLWMPDVHPAKKKININIAGHVLKNSIARDIHLARTGKVQLPEVINVEPPMGGKASRKDAPIYYLVAADRPDEKLMINKATVIVGRDNACDIVLDSIQVSRRHCLMQIVPRGLSFRDLDSTNGVTINGFPAKDGFLNNGDLLRFGTYALEIRQGKK